MGTVSPTEGKQFSILTDDASPCLFVYRRLMVFVAVIITVARKVKLAGLYSIILVVPAVNIIIQRRATAYIAYDDIMQLRGGTGSPGHRVTGSAILAGSGRVTGQCVRSGV